MGHEDYIGYLLNALDDDSMRQVEATLQKSPEARQELNLLRGALQPLDVDRDTIDTPPDLAMRTIALVASHVVEVHGRAAGTDATPVADFIRGLRNPGPVLPSTIYPSELPEYDGPSFKRSNVIAVAVLVVVLFALLLPGVLFLRDKQNTIACQQKLSTLHQSLMAYADTFEGTLPKVGEGETGESFVNSLHRGGLLPSDVVLVCPSAPTSSGGVNGSSVRPIHFAYNFGYRDTQGHLVGLRRGEVDGQTPLLADAPSPGLGRCLGEPTPVNHSKGQNVLFMNGGVRFCSHATLGADDNIFCNQQQQIRAGLNRFDSMLGRGDETP